MRDAFGGVFTMNLLLVFIFIYVAVTAVSLNYAKAFRAKNAVIDFIEQKEVTDLDKMFGLFSSDEREQLKGKLSDLSYYITCEQLKKEDSSLVQNIQNLFRKDEYCYNGVVFKEQRREVIAGTNSEIVYYDIETYATWNLGALNKLLALGSQGENSKPRLFGTWAVKGEAKVVIKK